MATRQERSAARVAEMDWSTFADAVRGPTRGTGGAATQRALVDYFEPADLRELRGLAEHAAARRAAAKVGNVVFLHGIMGSNLATVDAEPRRGSDTACVSHVASIDHCCQ